MQDKNETFYDEDEYIDVRAVLHNYGRILRKRWFILVILCALLSAGFIRYKQVTSVNNSYMASATYCFERGSDIYSNATVAARLAGGINTLTSTSDFRNEINEALGQEDVSGYGFWGTSTESSNLITVTVYSYDKELCNQLIEAFDKIYPDWVNKSIGSCSFVQQDVTYSTGLAPRDWSMVKMLILGIMGGCFLWICYATLWILFAKTVHDDYDMKQITSVTCLGTLPEIQKSGRKKDLKLLMTDKQLDPAYRQSLRALRQQVDKLVKADKRVIMVTSTDTNEGKSLITLNLAYAMKLRKKKVAVIDTDFYNQGIAAILQAKEKNEGTTLMDYLRDPKLPITKPQEMDGIYVLFAGNAEGEDVKYLNAKRLQEVIDRYKTAFDVILVDTAPVNQIGDALIFSEAVDSALYVVRCEYTQTREIISGMEPLYRNKKLAGYVLNCVKAAKVDQSGYYGYGYGYGRGYGNYAHYNTYHNYGNKGDMQEWED